MVTVVLKSEAVFAIIGVGSVVLAIGVFVALYYTWRRIRMRKSKAAAAAVKQSGITVTEARVRSRPPGARKTFARGPPDVEEGLEEGKIETPTFRGGLPIPTLSDVPRFSDSPASEEPQQPFQQTFSTYGSFYRALSETSASAPPSPRSTLSAVPGPTALARTREASRLSTVTTLADIALPSTPTKLTITSAWTGAVVPHTTPTGSREHEHEQEEDRSSLTTTMTMSTLPPSYRTRRSVPDVILPPPMPIASSGSGSPRLYGFPASETRPPPPSYPQAPAGWMTGTQNHRTAGGGSRSALASRPRSRSVGSATTVLPPAPYEYAHVHAHAHAQVDRNGDARGRGRSMSRSRSAVAAVPIPVPVPAAAAVSVGRYPKRSVDGGVRLAGGPGPPLSAPITSGFDLPPVPVEGRDVERTLPRSYFED